MDPSLLGRPMPAPTAHRTSGVFGRGTVLLIVTIVAGIIVGALLLMSSGDNSTALQQRVVARHDSLQKIIVDGQKNIVDDDLKKFNSELSLIMVGDAAAIKKAITASGSSVVAKPDKAIVAEESSAVTLAKLSDAKRNARYDAAYREVIKNQLESLRQLLRELYDTTRSSTLKVVVDTEFKHVSTFVKRLAELT